MPWGKDFLTEEQSPWCIAFLSTLLLGILLTLWDSIHHMITTTSQRWHLKKLIKILQWLRVFWHIFYRIFNGIELHVKWHWSNGFNELLITLSMLLHFVISCSTHNLLVFMAGLFSSPWYHHRWYLILKMGVYHGWEYHLQDWGRSHMKQHNIPNCNLVPKLHTLDTS